MRGKRTLWAVLGVVLAVVAVGAWIRWHASRRPSPVVVTPSARKLPELRATLTLLVQSERRVEILPGTPLLFEVSLSASKGMPPSAVGRAGRPWHSLMRLVSDDARQPLAWTIAPLGLPRSVAFAAGEGGELKVAESAADLAVVDHDHVHRLLLAASPETMSGVGPGTYAVRAVLEDDSKLESAPVTIVVRGAGEAPDLDRLERERVAGSAEFYLEAKRFEDARRLAEELVSREPKNTGAWMLLGDALDGLGKSREALAAYRRALAVSPRTYEEPTLLYERIGGMYRKLAH